MSLLVLTQLFFFRGFAFFSALFTHFEFLSGVLFLLLALLLLLLLGLQSFFLLLVLFGLVLLLLSCLPVGVDR